jgi:hypothetical protein
MIHCKVFLLRLLLERPVAVDSGLNSNAVTVGHGFVPSSGRVCGYAAVVFRLVLPGNNFLDD